MRIPSGTTDQFIYFVAVDDTDGTTRETGLSGFTVYRSRNGAAAAAMTTPTINETDSTNMPGVYELLLDEDMTIASGNDSEEMVFHITVSGMRPVTRAIELYRPKITAGQTLSVSAGAVTLLGSNVISSLQIADSAAEEIADAVLDEALSGHTTAGTLGKAIADTETDAAAILVDTAEIGAAGAGLTALADIIWDESLTAHTTANSAGRKLRELSANIIHTGTAQAGTATSITLDTGASGTDGSYDPSLIFITEGTGAGQARLILEYDGTSKVAIVDREWRVNPDATSEFVISGAWATDHVNEGLAQGGGASTITLNADASAVDDAYIGQIVFIRAGTGADQSHLVTDYDGTSKVATVSPAWTTQPDATSVYAMLPAGRGIAEALGTQAKADTNAEVLDVLNTDTFAEPTGVPPATDTLVNKIGRVHMALRNALEVTATKKTFFDDAGNPEWEKDLTDDGTTYAETEGNAI